MNIFQKAARDIQSQKAKNLDSPGFISRFLSGNPLFTESNYISNSLEGYKKSWVVYRCIRERSLAVSFLSNCLKVYKRAKKGEDEHLQEHELQTLLQKPNPYYSMQTLLEFWEMSRCLSGKAFWQLARLDLNDIPEQMFYLLPNRMKVIPDKEKYIVGYEYKVGAEKPQRLMPEQVLFFKMLDPLNPDFEGQSILEAGSRDIDISNKIQEWNKVFFDNAARPDGAFVVDGNLQDDSFDRMDEQVRRKYTGVANAHKPLLLEGGVKWQEISKTHKDMDFPKLKTMSRQDICDLHSVPTALISNRKEDGGTYNNKKEARKYFWEDTILPEGNDLIEQINNNLAIRYGDDIYVEIDTSEIPALKENADSRVDRINSKVEKNYITLNEARLEDGREEREGMDITLAEHQAMLNQRQLQTNSKSNFDMSEVKQLLMKVNQDLESLKKNDKKLDLFNQYKDLFNDKERSVIKENLSKSEITLEHAQKWFDYIKQAMPFEKEMNQLVTRLFAEQEKIVLDNLNSYEKSMKTKDISEDDIEEILFQLDEQQEYFFVEGEPIFRNTVQVFGSEALQSVGMSIDFDLENPRVAEFLENKTFKFSTQVNETTLEQLREQLIEGLQAGEGIPEITRRVQEVFENATRWRAENIARTEITSVAGGGTLEGYRQSGIVETKGWLASLDGRVRDSHAEANDQIVPLDEPFIIGGYEMNHPGDGSLGAPASEICFCRCAIFANDFTE